MSSAAATLTETMPSANGGYPVRRERSWGVILAFGLSLTLAGCGVVLRYFSDHEEAALAELEAHGREGLPSRYSSAEWEQMRRALFDVDLAADEHFGTGYNGSDDVFEVLGQVDEVRLARALDGHVYRFVPATGGRER
jgi:hypothetical protein